jgi:hypothetical protein
MPPAGAAGVETLGLEPAGATAEVIDGIAADPAFEQIFRRQF